MIWLAAAIDAVFLGWCLTNAVLCGLGYDPLLPGRERGRLR